MDVIRAVICIRAIHGYDRSDDDVTEFTTDGLYSYADETACLSYLESNVTGLEGTRTSIVITPESVIVDRDGNIKSRMIFRQGEKNAFQYETPYGTANMGVDTRSVSSRFDADGGELNMDFVMDMEHAVVSRSKFCVTVQPQHTGGTEHG